MADFRQLALEFVMEDDETKLTALGQKAATELQTAASSSNPVARWVEAVQPWMPGSNETEDSQETPDWTSRAKALEFLSRTLDFVKPDLLKPSQVQLLVAFFGAMFDIDHKAGILASATALSRIIAMKAFKPQSAYDIIQKVCAMKEDFQRQVAKTRLSVYELLRSLMTNPAVASDLQYRDGASAGFMTELLGLCRSERDPDCLIVWFDILRIFLQEYNPSQEVLEAVYGAFKAYYPITLPRISDSGITPEELKTQLRKCFSSTYRLASLTFPFLIGKLDQGDGVTVNVKVDVLKTIKACLEAYTHHEQSIIPFVNRIWGSLKYEVRNGEVEDTIWSTLEVLKTLATKLKGDNLRDYTLDVTRDCVTDLANPMYTSAAGRLIVSVLSASPSAFVLMVAPTITHIKENLRHPKSSTHTQDLLKVLYVILETRILLVDGTMTDQDRNDFSAVDGIFKNIYNEVYKTPLGLGCKHDANQDDIKASTEAVQGAGALISQRIVQAPLVGHENVETGLLLPSSTCSQITEDLFSIALQSFGSEALKPNSDELLNETAKALQRAVKAYHPGFKPLIEQFVKVIRAKREAPGEQAPETIQKLGSLLAYVGCSELPKALSDGLQNFLTLIHVFTTELVDAQDAKANPKIWCALAASIQTASRYFNEACLKKEPKLDEPFNGSAWLHSIIDKYPELQSIASPGTVATKAEDASLKEKLQMTSTQIRNDSILINLFIARQLYRRAIAVVEAQLQTGKLSLRLNDVVLGVEKAAKDQYLQLVSNFASYVIHEMSESQQLSLNMDHYVMTLFQDESIPIPPSLTEEQLTFRLEQKAIDSTSSWKWLAQDDLNILTFGLLEALRPSVVSRLFETGVAQELLISGVSTVSATGVVATRSIARSILTILANKFKIESLGPLIKILEEQLSSDLNVAKTSPQIKDVNLSLEKISSVYAVISGILRRYSGSQAKSLLHLLREAPNDPRVGYQLAQRLEMIVAAQKSLTKDAFAVIKPLWMQRVYMELVQPMLQAAVGSNPEVQDPLIKTNFGIGVLRMIKHMPFSIYEDDCAQILRVSISIPQALGVGADSLAALQVVKNILADASDQAQDHLRSIITITIGCFSKKTPLGQNRPEWLPPHYISSKVPPSIEVACGEMALEVLGALPRMFDSRHVLSSSPQVNRELSLVCGHPVRDLRRIARIARAAWSDVK